MESMTRAQAKELQEWLQAFSESNGTHNPGTADGAIFWRNNSARENLTNTEQALSEAAEKLGLNFADLLDRSSKTVAPNLVETLKQAQLQTLAASANVSNTIEGAAAEQAVVAGIDMENLLPPAAATQVVEVEPVALIASAELIANGTSAEVKALQAAIGTSADGAFGPNSNKKFDEWKANNPTIDVSKASDLTTLTATIVAANEAKIAAEKQAEVDALVAKYGDQSYDPSKTMDQDFVKAVQTITKHYGIDAGKVDGYKGPLTNGAVAMALGGKIPEGGETLAQIAAGGRSFSDIQQRDTGMSFAIEKNMTVAEIAEVIAESKYGKSEFTGEQFDAIQEKLIQFNGKQLVDVPAKTTVLKDGTKIKCKDFSKVMLYVGEEFRIPNELAQHMDPEKVEKDLNVVCTVCAPPKQPAQPTITPVTVTPTVTPVIIGTPTKGEPKPECDPNEDKGCAPGEGPTGSPDSPDDGPDPGDPGKDPNDGPDAGYSPCGGCEADTDSPDSGAPDKSAALVPPATPHAPKISASRIV